MEKLRRVVWMVCLWAALGFDLPMQAAVQWVSSSDEGIASSDSFGSNVAMSGDWAVAGNSYRSSVDSFQGSAYVLKRTSGVWAVHSRLLPDAEHARFGTSVAIHGGRMAIMAVTAGSIRTVFVYRLTAGVWQLETKLAGLRGEGGTVVMTADRIVCGFTQMILPDQPVLSYRLINGDWTLEQQITPPVGLAPSSRFGASLALDGDVLLIGSPGRQLYAGDPANLPGQEGRVFEYRRVADSWQQTRTILPTTSRAQDQFGLGVKMAAGRAVVFGKRLATFQSQGSDAYIYDISGTGWTLRRTLGGDNSLRCDSSDDLALSANKLILLSKVSGTVIEFQVTSQPASTWASRSILAVVVPFYVPYPSCIALEGDAGLLGVSSFFHDGGLRYGRIYPLSGSPSSVVGTPVIPMATRPIGNVPAIDGNTAVVGFGYHYDSQEKRRGYAHIIERESGEWKVVKLLAGPEPLFGGDSNFGSCVAVSGRRVAITDSIGYSETWRGGHVYIYERGEDGWPDAPGITLGYDFLGDNDQFAGQMAFAGDYLAVSEYSGSEEEQLVRVYRISGGAAVEIGLLKRRVTGESAFGASLSIRGSMLAVSDEATTKSGSATVGEILLYRLSPTGVTRVNTLRSASVKPRISFGMGVQLGDGVLTTKYYTTSFSTWMESFKANGLGWAPVPDIPQPIFGTQFMGAGELCVNGRQMLLLTERDARLYSWSPSGWAFVRIVAAPGEVQPSFYKAALSGDKAVISGGYRNVVGFYSTREIVAAAHALTSHNATPDGGTLHVGELKVGVPREVSVIFQNRGSSALRLTGVTATPGAGSSFVSSAFVPVTLGALESTVVKLTLNPPAAGEYTLPLELMHDDSSLGRTTFTLHHLATVDPLLPSGVSAESPVLAELGQRVSMEGDISPLLETTYQWFKEGRALSGQTRFVFDLPSAKASDAGHYRILIRTPGTPDASRSFRLGVYQIQAEDKKARAYEAVSFTAKAWGPGVHIKWSLPESWAVSGSQTSTLTLRRADALPHFPFAISATVHLLDQSALATLATLSLLHPPELIVSGTRVTPVEGETLINVRDRDDVEQLPFTLTITGLPPGTYYDESAYAIGGYPTKAGRYRITINSRNADGAGRPVYHDLLVYDAERGAPFIYTAGTTFAALVALPPKDDPDPDALGWRGLLSIQTTQHGAFSGTLRLRELTRRFSGRVTVAEGDAARRTGQITLRGLRGYDRVLLMLEEVHDGGGETLTPSFTGVLRLEDDADGNLGEVPAAFTPLMLPTSREKTAFPGRYSMLMSADDTSDVSASPLGAGFASMNVSQAMVATGVGTFPHGIGFTFSSPVLRPVDFSQPILPWVACSTEGDISNGILEWGEVFDNPGPGSISSQVIFSRLPKSGSRLYSAGVRDRSMRVLAARYFLPKEVPLLYNTAFNSPSWRFAALENFNYPPLPLTEPVDTYFQLTPAARAVFEKPNKWGVKLDIYSPTGFFTGQMTVRQYLPGPVIVTRPRRLDFRGMIIPGLQIGQGQVLYQEWPDSTQDPPVTTRNAQIFSEILRLSVQDGR
jgi:hypothetical protein